MPIMDNLQHFSTQAKKIPIAAIINYANKGLSGPEIAKQLDCTKENINQRLAAEGYNRNLANIDNDAEAKTLTYAGNKLLSAIIEKAESAPFQSQVYAYGVLFDKRQLLLNKPTSINGFGELPDSGLSQAISGLLSKAERVGIRLTDIVGELPSQLRDSIGGLLPVSQDTPDNNGDNLPASVSSHND
jgi:hypothetical protein